MSKIGTVVVVGAGHAGVQAAASLREEGFAGVVSLVSDEEVMPYQKPPLSKKFLKDDMDSSDLLLRGERFYTEHNIDLRLGDTVQQIDRGARTVRLASGAGLGYDHLILATGSKPRNAEIPGVDLQGVTRLCSVADAMRLRQEFRRVRNIVIVGAGFIGLELAATAAHLGVSVHVVEMAGRPLGRAVSEPISAFFADMHRASGVELSLGASISRLHGENGGIRTVELSDGRSLPADLVVLGIGALARDDLARAAGLVCGNGIEVDATLTTSDPDISAIGDCALYRNSFAGDRQFRLESVQNAVDQARVVARKLVGKPAHYDAVPWFWSDQGPFKLQIAGLSVDCDRIVCRGDQQAGDFAVYSFQGDVLRCVETVNRTGEHMAARRFIASRTPLTPDEVAAAEFDPRARVRQLGSPAVAS